MRESDMAWVGSTEAVSAGDTHEVLGSMIPVDMDEVTLATLGACPVLDSYGDDPTDGDGIPAMPAEEVAEFVAYAAAYNASRHRGGDISKGAVANMMAIGRIYRLDHRQVAEERLRRIEQGGGSSSEARNLRACLACDRAWSLWEVASGECLDLVTSEARDGREITSIDGTPYALTSQGERLIGTEEGAIPMWELMRECEGTDPYDYEEKLDSLLFEALIDNALVRNQYDECADW